MKIKVLDNKCYIYFHTNESINEEKIKKVYKLLIKSKHKNIVFFKYENNKRIYDEIEVNINNIFKEIEKRKAEYRYVSFKKDYIKNNIEYGEINIKEEIELKGFDYNDINNKLPGIIYTY